MSSLKKEPIGLDTAQRGLLLILSSNFKKNLGDDFSSREVMINYCWANYLQKLWIDAEHEVGNKQIKMAGHRRGSLKQIEKLQGYWPKAEAVLTSLSKYGEVDAGLTEIIRRDVAQQQTKKGGKR